MLASLSYEWGGSFKYLGYDVALNKLIRRLPTLTNSLAAFKSLLAW